MKPTITAFATSPDRGRGLARDMHVRWALEEVGQPYDVRLVTFAQMKEPAHKALQPFGQIPTYEEGNLALFESGSIILHLAETHPGTLLPLEPNARARAISPETQEVRAFIGAENALVTAGLPLAMTGRGRPALPNSWPPHC